MLLGHVIGETIPKVERGGMLALAPVLIDALYPPGGGGGNGNHIKAEPINEGLHFCAKIAPGGDD